MKSEIAKKSVSPTPEQTRNAFRISLGTALAMGIILISYVVFPPTYSYANETIILTVLVGLAGLASTWLSRNQRSNFGILILIFTLQFAILMTGFRTSGMGIVLALITLVITFGIATSSLPNHLANWGNAIAILIGTTMVLLDLIEPWTREPIANPVMVWATGGGLSLLFIYVIARQFSTYRLRTKITLVFLGVTLITASVLLGISQNTLDRSTQSNIEQALAESALSRATALGDYFVSQTEILRTLTLNNAIQANTREANASYSADDSAIRSELDALNQQWQAANFAQDNTNPLIQSRLNNEAAESLRIFQSYFPAHIDLLLIDRHGALIAATDSTQDYYLANKTWWQRSYEAGEIYIGVSEADATGNNSSVQIVVPVRDVASGEIIGVLHSTVPLVNILSSALGNDEREIDIVQDGQLWKSFAGQQVIEEYTQISQELWGTMQISEHAGHTETHYRNELRFLGYAHIRSSTNNSIIHNLGWLIVVSESKSSALAMTQSQSRQNLLLALGTIAFAAVASTSLATMLTAPITRLTQVAQEIAAGNTYARAAIETRDEVGLLASSFNDMTSKLQQMIDSLEQRIENRTKALQATIDVSQRISTILDPNQLTREIANELQSVFNYYHVHVYLLDEAKENLVMVGGSGEPGRIMLARKHKISSHAGLVGSAASQNQPVIVPDVEKDPNWLPNPLLPDTKTEVAVPISIGNRVLGVLDVQQSSVGGLSQSDVVLLQSIANQLAIAVQNTRAYSETQQRAEREMLIGAINQKLQKANSFDEILKTALDELKQALDLQQGSIELGLSTMRTDRDL